MGDFFTQNALSLQEQVMNENWLCSRRIE